jgi:hypothetical protein
MQKTRNLQRENHYLPACYQRGFADEHGKVWVKQTGEEPQYRRPVSVGRLRNFYIRTVDGVEDDSIETFFSRSVEDGFAGVSQKIKDEGPKVELSGTDLGYLVRFVATQVVRTMAHKECVDEQAGQSVDRDTYLRVMCRQALTIINEWLENLPTFQFLTPLPLVTHQFIAGDNPVLVFTSSTSSISGPPTASPVKGITNLSDILRNPNSQFVITLTPYMAVMVGQQRPHTPQVQVSSLDITATLRLNSLIRNQCSLFTLARDKESL